MIEKKDSQMSVLGGNARQRREHIEGRELCLNRYKLV